MILPDLEFVVESSFALEDYARVPIAFNVTEHLDVTSGDRAILAATLPTRAVALPYVKDYDAYPGQHPTAWPQRWDTSKWWFAAAFLEGQRIGGAVVIANSDGREAKLTAAPSDAAILWDIRIHPDFRRRGVGRALLMFAEAQARTRGRRHMQIETQHVNLAACRLYARAGYSLARINPGAYPTLPDEVQLIWQKDLC
jgi:ribosomal protein S18 acetylase RimI-like enzyme